jgi:hypothetical protein
MVEAIVFVAMVEVCATPKVMAMESIAALHVSGAPALGVDVSVTGPFDIDPSPAG